MIRKPISELLAEKYICILCPTLTEYISLFQFLAEWRDLEWKSGRTVTVQSSDWQHFHAHTVFCIRVRNAPSRRNRKYNITYTNTDDEDIPTSHVFTVEAFKNYIYQQGASSIFKYTLE